MADEQQTDEVGEVEEFEGTILENPTQEELGEDSVPVAALCEVFPNALQSARLRTHKRKDGSKTSKLEVGVGTKKAKLLYLPDIIQFVENAPSIFKVYKMAMTEEGRTKLLEMAEETEESLAKCVIQI